MMAALFALFVIEMILKSKTGGHSHGGPTGEGLSHAHAHAGPGLIANAAPHAVAAPPMYRGDSPYYADDEYPEEKDLAYAR